MIPIPVLGKRWRVSDLFKRRQGAWFEPRSGYMWQENTGVTPTTSGGQTIGLLLDLSQGTALGPEKATSANAAAAWTAYGNNTVTDVSGAVVITYVGGTNAGFGAYIYTAGLGLSAGTFYVLSYEASINTGSATFYINDGIANILPPTITSQTYEIRSCIFRYNGPGILQINGNLSTGEVLSIRNVSIKQIAGNHASQATAANRPILQFTGNLPLIRHADNTDVLTAAMPDLGGGVFSSAGSVYFSTPVGMSCMHNQSIGTSYNLPALQTDIYGVVITPARLAPPLEQRLARYMHRLAGLSDADFFWQEDYGPELVTNGDFSNGTTGWSAGATSMVAVESGELLITNLGSGVQGCGRSFVTVVGKTYRVSVTGRRGSSDTIYIGIGTKVINWDYLLLYSFATTNTTLTGVFTAADVTTFISAMQNGIAGNTGYFDNISVRELKDGIVGQLTDDSDELLLRA